MAQRWEANEAWRAGNALVGPNAAGGDVVAVADLAMLTTSADISPVNLPFRRNLARYGRDR